MSRYPITPSNKTRQDPNDAHKTGVTLAFYSSFLSCVPLVRGDADAEESSLLDGIFEWGTLLLERLFTLVGAAFAVSVVILA